MFFKFVVWPFLSGSFLSGDSANIYLYNLMHRLFRILANNENCLLELLCRTSKGKSISLIESEEFPFNSIYKNDDI